MEIFIAVIGALLVIIGLLGTFIPMLPGTPVSYAGLLLLLLIPGCTLTWKFFLVWGIIVVVLQILNYFIPIWGVNKFGGTKYGQWGSVLGVIVGLFAGPLGIIVGPIVGAVIAGTNFSDSLRAGFGSFLGTFIGMVLGIIVAAILMFYYFKEVFSIFF